MEEHVMQQHIDLYVNNETIQLSNIGKQAVEKMASLAGIHSNFSLFITYP
jgi:predicted solute-binding protein